MSFELLAAGDRRLVGTGDPGIYIDAARIHHVAVGRVPRDFGREQWIVEVMTTEVIDRDVDPVMMYSPHMYSIDYPNELAARRAAAQIEAFVSFSSTGAEAIAAERQRQIDEEGWTPSHDDEHDRGDLVVAALSYAEVAAEQLCGVQHGPADREWFTRTDWSWDPEWWKPSDDPIRNLVKAGALIAAELDRVNRSANMALDFHLCREHRDALPDEYWRTVIVPVGAKVVLEPTILGDRMLG
jgi:hypothetical protein